MIVHDIFPFLLGPLGVDSNLFGQWLIVTEYHFSGSIGGGGEENGIIYYMCLHLPSKVANQSNINFFAYQGYPI